MGHLRWPTTRIVQVVFTVFSLAVTTAVMMNVVHLNPLSSTRDLVFDDTTPTGGDMGAHVWGPAFLRDHLLPSFQLNGWSIDWYAGMPMYRFYMVVPALLIVALDIVLAVRRRLQGRRRPRVGHAPGALLGIRPPRSVPVPDARAVRVRRSGVRCSTRASQIYGGNLKSTMAGEFSFSIALSLGVLGLGLFVGGSAHRQVPRLGGGRARRWRACRTASC